MVSSGRYQIHTFYIIGFNLTDCLFCRGGFSKMAGVDNPWLGRPNNAPFDREFYFIFNVAVGGTNGWGWFLTAPLVWIQHYQVTWQAGPRQMMHVFLFWPILNFWSKNYSTVKLYCKSRIFCMHVIFVYFVPGGFRTKIKCMRKVQGKSRESAAVSDCTKISCVRKVGEPRIRKLSAYEIFWIYSTLKNTSWAVGRT